MNILALDTATEACSVAVLSGSKISEIFEIAPRRHTEIIFDMIDAVLNHAGVDKTELDAITFGRGPGAFTGVRLATALVQGIAYAADVPVIPVSTLAAMAQGAYRLHAAEKVLVAIDARMQEVYWGAFQLDAQQLMQAVIPESVCAPETVASPEGKGWFAVGTGWSSYKQALGDVCRDQLTGKPIAEFFPSAQDYLVYAKQAYQNKKFVSAEQAQPVYLRDKVAIKSQIK